VWDANSWVTYPHWIYPGDTLLIPSLMVMPGGKLEDQATLPDILDGFYPAAAEDSFQCGHFIVDPNETFEGSIVGAEADPTPLMLSKEDVVYINLGAKDGVLPGDEFAIIYPRMRAALSASETKFEKETDLRHPMTGERLGVVMKMAGRLKVILLGESVSTCRIVYACDAIEQGFSLYPYMQRPIPMVRRKARESHFNEMAKRGRGYIVWIADQAQSGMPGQLVSIDLGSRQGVIPGDVFTVYRDHPSDFPTSSDINHLGSAWDYRLAAKREREHRDRSEKTIFGKQLPRVDLPPKVVGHIVVLYTEQDTATARAFNDNRVEFYTSDRIVYEPVDEGLTQVPLVQGTLIPDVPLTRQPSTDLTRAGQ